MIAEGKITIDLGADGSVRLLSNRTALVASLLEGRPRDEALELLPRLFSLCANAHVAAARAAMGLEIRRKDTLLVLAENAREHLLRIMLGWKAEGEVLRMPAPPVMALVSDMETAQTESDVANTLSDYLEAHVLGARPETFLQIKTLAQFDEWLGTTDTGVTVFLNRIRAKNWQSLGAITPDFLPDLPSVALLERLNETSFTQRPDWLGEPRETGPLARQHAQPLVVSALGAHGAGLLARMVARLVELAQIPDQMQQDQTAGSHTNGLGIVETARGRLIHAARLGEDVITRYRILAPTEWNFHARGAAMQSLASLPDGDQDTRRRQARRVLEAIDPCVDFELRVA